MDRNTIVAVVFSVGILLAWSTLFPPPKKTPPVPELALNQTLDEKQPTQEIKNATGTTSTNAQELPAATTLVESAEGAVIKDITVEGDLYTAKINTQGGILSSMLLKKYQHHKDSINWFSLLPFLKQFYDPTVAYDPTEGNQIQMVKKLLNQAGSLQVSFEDNKELSQAFAKAVYSSNVDLLDLRQKGDYKIILTSPKLSGIQIEKTLEFQADSYIFNWNVRIVNWNETDYAIKPKLYFGEGRFLDPSETTSSGHTGALYFFDGKVQTESTSDLEQEFRVAAADWIGIEDQYFISAVAPLGSIQHGFFQAFKRTLKRGEHVQEPIFGITLTELQLQPKKQVEARFKIYMGPKDTVEMVKFGQNLQLSHQMSLEFLASKLLDLLQFIFSYVGNYGIAIILLTICVRIVLFPLTYKGTKAMRRMQQLQPKMVKLRDKYKNNKEKMNQEIMEMYRKHKVNPLGGCLPILLQIPIFFALYSALSTAVELRHAPFYLWITDLSAADGLGVTPILMGVTMYILQKLTPNAMMDPMQQKVMNMLPLIFTVFTFTFPAGLTLYWVTSNFLSILQQKLLNRIKLPEVASH